MVKGGLYSVSGAEHDVLLQVDPTSVPRNIVTSLRASRVDPGSYGKSRSVWQQGPGKLGIHGRGDLVDFGVAFRRRASGVERRLSIASQSQHGVLLAAIISTIAPLKRAAILGIAIVVLFEK